MPPQFSHHTLVLFRSYRQLGTLSRIMGRENILRYQLEHDNETDLALADYLKTSVAEGVHQEGFFG